MPPKKRPALNDEQYSFGDYKRKLRKLPLKLPNNERKMYTIKKPYPQNFSLPENIVYYISQNPIKVKCHRNLAKTCKSIFRHSRIIPVDEVYMYNVVTFMNKYARRKDTVRNFENLSSFKIWIHCHLSISNKEYSNLASKLTKNLYQCSLEFLVICDQILAIGELQILAGGGKLQTVNLCRTVVKNADGSITEFEKVFEILLCKNMHISFHSEHHGVGKNTAKKIAEILESQRKSYHVTLGNIPLIFDFNVFSEFLKANMANRKHTMNLFFDDIASDENKNQLQQFVNEIIQNRDIRGRAVPIIEFDDQNDEAYSRLRNMRGI